MASHKQATTMEQVGPSNGVKLALAWLAVGGPLLWGVIQTLRRAMALFS